MYEMLVFLDFFLSYKGTIHILCIFLKEVIEKVGCPMSKRIFFTICFPQ